MMEEGGISMKSYGSQMRCRVGCLRHTGENIGHDDIGSNQNYYVQDEERGTKD